MGNARLGTDTGPNPTDRAESALKLSLLATSDGGLLSIVVVGPTAPDAKPLQASQALRAFRRAGWFLARQSGSHAVLRHPEREGRLVLPRHAGVTFNPGLLAGLLKDAGLSADEFRALL